MIHPFIQDIHLMSDFGLFREDQEARKNEFLLFIEQNIKPETDYIKFITEFNKIAGMHFIGDIESMKLYYENEAFYSHEQKIMAVKNAITNPWFKEHEGVLIPKFILKPENMAIYINYRPPKQNNKQPITKFADGNYSEIQHI